jgi:hypothetical protein
MSQGLRNMLANRKFAIPLIILLAFCFIGLLLIGIVLVSGLTSREKSVAKATPTTAVAPTSALVTFTPAATKPPTPKPSPTLVRLGTAVSSAGGENTPAATTAATVAGAATKAPTTAPTSAPTTKPTSAQGAGAQATATPGTADEELAQTGVGWGLILASGIGLALLVVAVRRLRLAS